MSYIESSLASEGITSMSNRNSLAPSLAKESTTTYSDTEDSIISSLTDVYRNQENLQNVPSKQDNITPFYRRKRFWGICIAITVVLAAIFIPVLFLVIIPSKAQNIINKSKIDFQSMNITNATNDSFLFDMSGEVSGAGQYDSKLEFNGPVTIIYNNKELGTAELENLNVTHGKGSVIADGKRFIIKDKELFTNFVSETITASSLKWTLRGSVNVRTLGMNIKNLNLNNEITIPGSNGYNASGIDGNNASGLTDLKVNPNPDHQSFNIEVTASLYNPSPIGVELGDIALQLSYNGTILADGIAKGVFIKAKENNITMTGVSKVPTTDSDRLNYVKVLLNSYLSSTPIETNVKILSVISPNGEIDWINSAVQNINLTFAIGKTPINFSNLKILDYLENF